MTSAPLGGLHSEDVEAGGRGVVATSDDRAKVVRPLLRTPLLELGEFRCHPSHPSWEQENSIGSRAHLVFPGPPVGITRPGIGRQVEDRNWVVLYRPGESYLRDAIHPAGDVSSYVAMEPALVDEYLDAAPAGVSPWREGRVRVGPTVWMNYRVLLGRARDGTADPLAVESQVVDVLSTTAGGTAYSRNPLDRATVRGGRRSRRTSLEVVNEAVRIMNRRLADRLTLADLAGAVGVSVFHLCRIFRAVTGTTVHAYQEQLRLRSAFVRLADPEARLSDIAGRVGFSSHSHLTTRFAMSFGVPPSAMRSLNSM